MNEALDDLPQSARVAVIGLGLMGSAATWALARRGFEVVAFDAREPGHRHGSSHGSSRIFRRAYLNQEYIRMSAAALELWRRLEADAGRSLLTLTGALNHGPYGSARLLYDALSAARVSCTLMSPEEAAERWPHQVFEGETLHHPEAGVLDPELAIAESLRLARAAGARIQLKTPVLRVEPQSKGVDLRLHDGRLHAGQVVVTAGPWIPRLLGGVVPLPPLVVTQQQVFHFPCRGANDGTLWPAVLHDTRGLFYGLPGGRDGGGAANIKLGEHAPGRATSAEHRDGVIDPAARRRMIDYVGHWWPGLEQTPVAEYSCLYTSTPSEDFFLERFADLIVCSACSGHGAKFAPLIGEWVADLVEGRKLPSRLFSLEHHRAD